jgi:hypothetical protein
VSATVTSTAVLPVVSAAVWFCRKLAAHRRTIGTRKSARHLTSVPVILLVPHVDTSPYAVSQVTYATAKEWMAWLCGRMPGRPAGSS